jgi:6-phosphogluconolactonase
MGMTGRRVVTDDVAVLQRVFAADFTEKAAEIIARRGKFVVALPGGSVATTFLPVLAGIAVDWAHIDLFWIDERAVPPDHPESNYGIASRLLLTPARVPLDRIHRMQGELPELEQAARRASDELRSVAGDPPRLDLALVGVGEDGHVASIFSSRPSARADSSTEARSAKADPVIAVHDAPKPPPRRLTMTLPVLARAGIVVVAAFGASKAKAMRDAIDQRDGTPVARLLRGASSSLVLLDREAGLS